jgi:AcrR family transcriptional regulator
MTKAEKTRQFIIEQSAALFNTKGIAGTSMSDIMNATRMAKGGLYGNFESKEDLACAIVDYNLQVMAAALNRAVAKAGTAKEKLFAYLDVFSKPVQFPVEGGCPVLNFGVEADDTHPVIKDKVKNLIEAAQKIAAGIIRQGIRDGEFKDTFDAKSFSILMFTVIEGGTLIGRVLNTNSQMATVIRMVKQLIVAQET